MICTVCGEGSMNDQQKWIWKFWAEHSFMVRLPS